MYASNNNIYYMFKIIIFLNYIFLKKNILLACLLRGLERIKNEKHGFSALY